MNLVFQGTRKVHRQQTSKLRCRDAIEKSQGGQFPSSAASLFILPPPLNHACTSLRSGVFASGLPPSNIIHIGFDMEGKEGREGPTRTK